MYLKPHRTSAAFDKMFSVEYKYKESYRFFPKVGEVPAVSMNIAANGKSLDLLAIIDTGSANTIISPDYAVALSIEIENGEPKQFHTATGEKFLAYAHQMEIRILNEFLRFQVYFPDQVFHRCLIGRDLLNEMQVGVKESHSTVYLF